MIQYVRKFFISLLLLWFLIAICMMVFGTDLFSPFDLDIDQSEKMYRYKTIRFAAGCLLAYAVFRYLFSFKATPSLGNSFQLRFFFYLAGGIIFAYRDNVEIALPVAPFSCSISVSSDLVRAPTENQR